MIPSPFEDIAASTVEEAVQALSEAGEDAKVLAGGQSLLPVLRLRLAAPTMIVDLSRVNELRGVRDDGDAIIVGAMTTHHDVINGMAAEGTSPMSDGNADADYREHLARVLTGRAVGTAARGRRLTCMKLKNEFSVPASVDTVWQALLDPERVAPCFPGATITSADGDEFAGLVKVRLGPISLQYGGRAVLPRPTRRRTAP